MTLNETVAYTAGIRWRRATRRRSDIVSKNLGDFMDEEEFDQAVIELLTLALMRLTCAREQQGRRPPRRIGKL